MYMYCKTFNFKYIFCLEKQVVCGQAFDAECINISLFFLALILMYFI